MAGQMPQISGKVYISTSIFYSLKRYKNKTQNVKEAIPQYFRKYFVKSKMPTVVIYIK